MVNAPVARADWADTHCDLNGPTTPSSWAHENARSYAATANGDGYDWGGGCWDSDGQDDTPLQDGYHNAVGEGPDCSGFTFKSCHIGMIYSEGSGWTDSIIEAKDQQINTGIFVRNYRVASGYSAVRRANWDVYCPQCG